MRAAVATCALMLLAGCPSDPGNPETLWLALDGSELRVKLVDSEPRPY
jgi:hypothetical protein